MNAKSIAILGNLAIAALVLWITASIALNWIAQRRNTGLPVPTGPPSSREAVPRQQKTLEEYAAISDKNIFHSEKGPAAATSIGEEDIKVTELNLGLKGTVVGEGRNSYAVIIDHDSGKEDVYFQDDFVMGARIARISPSKVILNFNGNEEALLMSDESRVLPELGSSSRQGPASRPPLRRVTPPRRSARASGQ